MRLNSSRAVARVASSDRARAIDVRCLAPATAPMEIPTSSAITVIVTSNSMRVKAARGRMAGKDVRGAGDVTGWDRTSNLELRTLNIEVQPTGGPIYGSGV